MPRKGPGLIAGELSADLAAAVEHHVTNCLSCPALHRAMVGVDSHLLAQRPSPGPSPGQLCRPTLERAWAQRWGRPGPDAAPNGHPVIPKFDTPSPER